MRDLLPLRSKFCKLNGPSFRGDWSATTKSAQGSSFTAHVIVIDFGMHSSDIRILIAHSNKYS